MAEIVPDTASSTEIVQECALVARPGFLRLRLQMLADVLKICTFAGRSTLNKLLPAVGVAKTGFTNAFEDVVLGLHRNYLDVAVVDTGHELLAATES